MYLVVGLGNPGRQYEATRHNMGFDTIDVLVERHKIPQGGVKFNAMYGSGFIGGEKVIFMKPLSFMNLSGGPVQEWQPISNRSGNRADRDPGRH